MDKTDPKRNDNTLFIHTTPNSRENRGPSKVALVAFIAFVALSCIVLGALAIASAHYGFGSGLPLLAKIGWKGGTGLLFSGLIAGISALLYGRSLYTPVTTSPSLTTSHDDLKTFIPQQENGSKDLGKDTPIPSVPKVNVSSKDVAWLLKRPEQDIKDDLKTFIPRQENWRKDLGKDPSIPSVPTEGVNAFSKDVAWLLELTENNIRSACLQSVISMKNEELLQITVEDFEKIYTPLQQKVIAERLARIQAPTLNNSFTRIAPEMTLEIMRKQRISDSHFMGLSDNLCILLSTQQWNVIKLLCGAREHILLPQLSFPIIKHLFENDIIKNSVSNLKLIPTAFLKQDSFPWAKFLYKYDVWEAFSTGELKVIPWNLFEDKYLGSISYGNISKFAFLKEFPVKIFNENAHKFSARNLCKLLFFLCDQPNVYGKVFLKSGILDTLYSLYILHPEEVYKITNSIPWSLASDSFLEEEFKIDEGSDGACLNLNTCSNETIRDLIPRLPISALLGISFKPLKKVDFPWDELLKRLQGVDSFPETSLFGLGFLIESAPPHQKENFETLRSKV